MLQKTKPFNRWYRMPDIVSVRCPHCRAMAAYEFAEVRSIDRRKKVAAFKKSRAFEYWHFHNCRGGRWHGAVYYHGLRGITRNEAASSLPQGYLPNDWADGKRYRSHDPDFGTLNCSHCSTRRKHRLKWPQEAFFQIDYRGKLLWAFNRDSLSALRSFIVSNERRRLDTDWGWFLFHIPSHFLSKKARAEISKKLDKLARATLQQSHRPQ